jgi:Asp-tRNA(Asn)/Glu-tRNA(Gln) amidotransferase A subunit family amidase
VGANKESLPIGMQIFGKHFAEGMILRVANAYEKAA